ncbi:DENN domain and WD repeat-containing protein SCD1 isoform X1 [Senna tora]|uniref:DENN domain and WD repeat-containing protein SCD1 isoform X1 n=1 Tax=Senna tora TaxID=362788 RepID=A0A834WY11_9FABA|nr:DENN domain and WD repeat-containing protein SCD1 isoform X1 [Senna tora]
MAIFPQFREFLSNKKLEEIPTVVESLLSKVVEECEHRVLIQHEMGPISDSDVGISGSGAQYTYDRFPSNIRTEKQLEEKRKQILAAASSAFEYLGRHTPSQENCPRSSLLVSKAFLHYFYL